MKQVGSRQLKKPPYLALIFPPIVLTLDLVTFPHYCVEPAEFDQQDTGWYDVQS